MFRIFDGREEFYQWDLNRKLIVDDESIKQVHFCNKTDDCSLVVETYKDGELTVANVPNILLQTAWRIRVYGYTGDYTKHEASYKVNPRTRPADYVYTETETVKLTVDDSAIGDNLWTSRKVFEQTSVNCSKEGGTVEVDLPVPVEGVISWAKGEMFQIIGEDDWKDKSKWVVTGEEHDYFMMPTYQFVFPMKTGIYQIKGTMTQSIDAGQLYMWDADAEGNPSGVVYEEFNYSDDIPFELNGYFGDSLGTGLAVICIPALGHATDFILHLEIWNGEDVGDIFGLTLTAANGGEVRTYNTDTIIRIDCGYNWVTGEIYGPEGNVFDYAEPVEGLKELQGKWTLSASEGVVEVIYKDSAMPQIEEIKTKSEQMERDIAIIKEAISRMGGFVDVLSEQE